MGRKKKSETEETKTAFESLTDREKLLVKAYIENLGVQYKAYMQVFPNSKYESARVESSKYFAKPSIRKAIEEEYARIWKEKDSELEKSKTFAMIHAIGNSDISDIVDLKDGTLIVKSLDEIPPEARHCIQSIEYIRKETQHGMDENIKVKLHSKLQALEMRAKIQKLIDPKDDTTKVEITINPAKRPDKEKKSKKGESERE